MMRPLTTNTKPISSCRMNRLFRLASRAMAEEPGGPRGLLSTHYDQPEEEEEEEQHLCQNTRAEVHLMSGAVPYHGGLLYRPRLHGPSANITDLQRKRGAQKKNTKREKGLETFGVRKEVLEQVSKAAPKAVGAEKPHDYHCHVCHDEDLSGPTHLLV